jgi:hypothetical protein
MKRSITSSLALAVFSLAIVPVSTLSLAQSVNSPHGTTTSGVLDRTRTRQRLRASLNHEGITICSKNDFRVGDLLVEVVR